VAIAARFRHGRGLIVVKAEWGTKRICQSCGARFYDFQRSPIACPACGATFELETLQRARRTRGVTRSAAATTAVAAETADADEDELEAVADDASEDADYEDADELGEEGDVDVDVVRDDDDETT
jgi:uncharacterized protein (TIGR02300 family)